MDYAQLEQALTAASEFRHAAEAMAEAANTHRVQQTNALFRELLATHTPARAVAAALSSHVCGSHSSFSDNLRCQGNSL